MPIPDIVIWAEGLAGTLQRKRKTLFCFMEPKTKRIIRHWY